MGPEGHGREVAEVEVDHRSQGLHILQQGALLGVAILGSLLQPLRVRVLIGVQQLDQALGFHYVLCWAMLVLDDQGLAHDCDELVPESLGGLPRPHEASE